VADEIRIQIDGDGVRPDTVQLMDLISILNNFHAAVLETARAGGTPREDVRISLTKIESGSDTLVFSSDPRTHVAAQRIVKAIESQDETIIPPRARKNLTNIWTRTIKNKWSVKIDPRSSPAATITHAKRVFRVRKSKGSTSLLCHVILVGGKGRPTVKIQLPTGEVLTADVANRDLAEEIGKRLYKTIELRGRVTWSMRDWSIQEFFVQSIGDYCKETSDPGLALRNLSDLSRGSWDSVDPNQFIEDLRGE